MILKLRIEILNTTSAIFKQTITDIIQSKSYSTQGLHVENTKYTNTRVMDIIH